MVQLRWGRALLCIAQVTAPASSVVTQYNIAGQQVQSAPPFHENLIADVNLQPDSIFSAALKPPQSGWTKAPRG
ncbi:hypothetical protein BH20VER1_BH20VER1_29600 [soil metagenome]